MRIQRLKMGLAVPLIILEISMPEMSVAQLDETENVSSAQVDLSQRATFRLIPEESEIHFAVVVPILPDFSGQAERFEGTISGVPSNLEKDTFAEVVIEVASMETGLRPRDRDMHRALEAETYPRIRFSMVPGKLEHLGKRPIVIMLETVYISKVIGTLEIRGVEREINMEVEWEVSGDYIRVSGETSLLLSEYAIERPRAPFLPIRVDDEIQVGFSVRGRLTKD
ncbi:MAG: YceI family protein [Candidatus Neomarinimicrobiota bacterium]